MFYHPVRNLRVVVHGDDFTILGMEEDLRRFRCQIQSRYECKLRGMLGPGDDDEKSIRILNRVITWNHAGITYEADQRHAEIIVKSMGLREQVRSVTTPYESKLLPEEGEPLGRAEARLYRGLAARGNYLSQDRSDIQYAVKEISRTMANPCSSDWGRLKRLARYLHDRTRCVSEYKYVERDSPHVAVL